MPMKLEMTGITEVRARFASLREGAKGEASRKAVRAGAKVLQDAIAEAAPVLDHKTAKSSALDPHALQRGIEIRMRTDKVGFISAEVGPKDYLSHVAYWVEFGHFLVKGGYLSLKHGKTQGHGHRVGVVEQHPFIRPAADDAANRAVEAYANTMAEWLKGMVR